jgi:two-component system LytT family sensor kinase
MVLNDFLFTLFGFQKTRNASHFIVIILIHTLAWCLFFILPLIFLPIRFSNSRLLYAEFLSKLLPIGFFYLNYYFLLPRFFERRKFLAYFGIIIGCIIIISAQEVILRQNMPGRSVRFFSGAVRVRDFPDRTPAGNFFVINSTDSFRSHILPPDSFRAAMPVSGTMINEDILFGIPRGIFLVSINRSISICLVLLLIGGFIRLGYSFLRNQNEKKALENAHLNAEVNFLKSQINPHFLFNTLNSIYSQAHNKSEHTEYSILKLSELLRYMLYESGELKVPLERDIMYLNNYIDLQRMRLSRKVNIHYNVEGQLEENTIAPLLLITFIENAFKHGISYTRASVINIDIKIFEKTLTLLVSNPVTETNSFTNGGVGLKNVARRLELLYAGNYLLDIVNNDHVHIVNLKINLTSD